MANEDTPGLLVADTVFVTGERGFGNLNPGAGVNNFALTWNETDHGWGVVGHAVGILIFPESNEIIWIAHPHLEVGIRLRQALAELERNVGNTIWIQWKILLGSGASVVRVGLDGGVASTSGGGTISNQTEYEESGL